MESINTTNVYVVWRNHILLIQRSAEDGNLPSYWEAPAGHVDVYCPPIDSTLSRKEALRELREETGYYTQVIKFNLKKKSSFFSDSTNVSEGTWKRYVYSPGGGAIIYEDSGNMEDYPMG